MDLGLRFDDKHSIKLQVESDTAEANFTPTKENKVLTMVEISKGQVATPFSI